jgi:hypothetical protein
MKKSDSTPKVASSAADNGNISDLKKVEAVSAKLDKTMKELSAMAQRPLDHLELLRAILDAVPLNRKG